MFWDLIWFALAAWLTVRISSEGAWGAVIVLLAVLFSGLFAMNTFEPLAERLEQSVAGDPSWAFRWDLISLLGLFACGVLLLRFLCEQLAPADIPLPWPAEFAIRWAAGITTAYLTIAILLTSLHVAPLPRLVTSDEILEPAGLQMEQEKFFGMAPDRQWLKFNQWLSQHGFSRENPYRVFDGPYYHFGGDSGLWPSFPIRYAARREAITRSRVPSEP